MPEIKSSDSNNSILLLLLIAGLFLVAYLIYRVGFFELINAMSAIKWAIFPIFTIHIVQIIFCAFAWYVLSPDNYGLSSNKFIIARWIRESIASLLPIAQIGGEVIGARVLTLSGMRGVTAASSVIVDLTIEVLTLFIFTIIGVALFSIDYPQNYFIKDLDISLIITALILIVFLVLQRHGLFRWLSTLIESLADRWSLLRITDMDNLHDEVQSLYANKKNLVKASIYHMSAWIFGALEIWLILYYIGMPVSLTESLLLECFTLAIRSAAFFLPGGLGAQEGGFIFIGYILGIPPHISLAVSLIKRCREIILGVPGLLFWHILESRNFSGKTFSKPVT